MWQSCVIFECGHKPVDQFLFLELYTALSISSLVHTFLCPRKRLDWLTARKNLELHNQHLCYVCEVVFELTCVGNVGDLRIWANAFLVGATRRNGPAVPTTPKGWGHGWKVSATTSRGSTSRPVTTSRCMMALYSTQVWSRIYISMIYLSFYVNVHPWTNEDEH